MKHNKELWGKRSEHFGEVNRVGKRWKTFRLFLHAGKGQAATNWTAERRSDGKRVLAGRSEGGPNRTTLLSGWAALSSGLSSKRSAVVVLFKMCLFWWRSINEPSVWTWWMVDNRTVHTCFSPGFYKRNVTFVWSATSLAEYPTCTRQALMKS